METAPDAAHLSEDQLDCGVGMCSWSIGSAGSVDLAVGFDVVADEPTGKDGVLPGKRSPLCLAGSSSLRTLHQLYRKAEPVPASMKCLPLAMHRSKL